MVIRIPGNVRKYLCLTIIKPFNDKATSPDEGFQEVTLVFKFGARGLWIAVRPEPFDDPPRFRVWAAKTWKALNSATESHVEIMSASTVIKYLHYWHGAIEIIPDMSEDQAGVGGDTK